MFEETKEKEKGERSEKGKVEEKGILTGDEIT